MYDKQSLAIGVGWIELYVSLLKSVSEAGGSIDCVRYDKIKDMRVVDLFNIIAINHIRFTHVKEEE